MPPFLPFDNQIQWDLSAAEELAGEWSFVFGSPSPYEAYLFCLTFRQMGPGHLIGAGMTEKEVEDLVETAKGTVCLLLMDGISRDAGIELVTRIRQKRPDTRAMLLVTSLESYRRNKPGLGVFNGLMSANGVGKGIGLACLSAIQRGERFVDKQLTEIKAGEADPWNELNQRERAILPLLARGLKNKEIATELFIAETTTRDYVSSILSKLEVSNRAAAAAWAIEHGFSGG